MTISQFVTVEWAPASDPTDLTPTWVDITSRVQSVDVSGGRSGVFDLYGPRTCTITARNGRKSPVEAATWAIGGFYKWRQVRVTSVSQGDYVFAGYIQTVTHDQSNAPFHGMVTIECVDLMGVLARAEFLPTDSSGGTINGLTLANTLSTAATYALSLCGLTQTPTIDSPSTALFKLPDQPSGQVLSWLQGVLEGEAGGFQVQSDGVPYVNGRWLPFAVALLTPTLTFSDTAGVGEYKYLRENLTLGSADTDYYNQAVAKSTYWEPTFTVSNVPSGYPKETLSRTDLPFVYQSWAEANAAHYVKLYSQALTYPRTLNVYLASTHAESPVIAAAFLQVCRNFGGFHVVVKHTAVGDTQKTYHVTVENAHHSITPDVWTCQLGFASLDRWMTAYGTGSAIYELIEVDGDAGHGVASAAIVAP